MNIWPQVLVAGALAIVSLAIPSGLRAQAPAGPIHPAHADPASDPHAAAPEAKKPLPRHDLWGNWMLNTDRSDDPRKKMNESGGGNRGGVGFPGGRGGYPGRSRDSNADRSRTDDLIFPANSFTLARKDAEVDLTDDQDRKRVLYTDGRKLQKSKDDKYKELAARWDGPRLVADEKGPNGMKLTRSFEISPDGQRLYETLAIDRGGDAGFVLIRYVFDPAKQDAQPDTASKASPADAKP